MEDKESVTIIMATHNNAGTVQKALQSVTDGHRPADQIVVGDNDSTDNTYEILCNLLGAELVTINEQVGLPPEFDGILNGVPINNLCADTIAIKKTIDAFYNQQAENK